MPTFNHPVNKPNWALPLFVIVAGLSLIAFGWASQELDLSEINVNPVTTMTPQVVVVPNGDVPTPAPVPNLAANLGANLGALYTSAPMQRLVEVVMPPPTMPAREAQPVAISVLTVTATAEPVIYVTATLPPVMAATVTSAAIIAAAQKVGGHCAESTAGCAVMPTATTAPTYAATAQIQTPTPLPSTPTITPTPAPESNSVRGVVTRQGALVHGGTEVLVIQQDDEGTVLGVMGRAVTDESGEFLIHDLDRGTYQVTAYSANGSHLPACKTIILGGNQEITLPPTMLSNGNLTSDETMNLGAAALVAIELGLSIPEYLLPILDVSGDELVSEVDANMIIADPKLLACQAW